MSKRAKSQIHSGKHLAPLFTKCDSFVIRSSSDDENGRTVRHSTRNLEQSAACLVRTLTPMFLVGAGTGMWKGLEQCTRPSPKGSALPYTLEEGTRRGNIPHLPGHQEHLLQKSPSWTFQLIPQYQLPLIFRQLTKNGADPGLLRPSIHVLREDIQNLDNCLPGGRNTSTRENLLLIKVTLN